jgi:hypothetical protein
MARIRTANLRLWPLVRNVAAAVNIQNIQSCDDCIVLNINMFVGHPSCMELGEVGEVIRSYSWKCIECKTCEICQEKGDDVSPFLPSEICTFSLEQERILFCDFCDRGKYMRPRSSYIHC